MAATSTAAQQEFYRETPEGWFIYREGKSCVLYTDTSGGTMLRFSSRVDESRTYFSAFNEAWKLLSPRLDQSVMISLDFPELKRGYGSAGVIIRNVDGRLGMAGSSFPIEELHRLMTAEGEMRLTVLFDGDEKSAEVERVNIKGAAMAVNHLIECTEKYFSE